MEFYSSIQLGDIKAVSNDSNNSNNPPGYSVEAHICPAIASHKLLKIDIFKGNQIKCGE